MAVVALAVAVAAVAVASCQLPWRSWPTAGGGGGGGGCGGGGISSGSGDFGGGGGAKYCGILASFRGLSLGLELQYPPLTLTLHGAALLALPAPGRSPFNNIMPERNHGPCPEQGRLRVA